MKNKIKTNIQLTRQILHQINRINCSSAKYENILRDLRIATNGMQTRVKKNSSSNLYFRARVWNHEKLELIEDLGPPPAHTLKTYGRCNPPGVPMFYTSSRRKANLWG